jgi:hypothetical protein
MVPAAVRMLGIFAEGRPSGHAFRAPKPFRSRNQRCCQDAAKHHAHARAEQALLNGIAHEEQAAERERHSPDPHRPLRPQALLETHASWRCRAVRRHRRNRSSRWFGLRRARGRLRWAFRLWARFDRRRSFMHRSRRHGFGRRFAPLACLRSRWRCGQPALERCEPRLHATQLIPQANRHHQSDDRNDRNGQQQQAEQEQKFHRRPQPAGQVMLSKPSGERKHRPATRAGSFMRRRGRDSEAYSRSSRKGSAS